MAFNPTQFAPLQDDPPILPDTYSERFGLRADPIKAAERARYFMSWAPPDHSPPEQTHIKKCMICTFGITSIGYMHLMENGTLQKGDGHNPFRTGYYRWHGPMHRCMKGRDEAQNTEHLLGLFENEYTEIIEATMSERRCSLKLTASDWMPHFRQNSCTLCVSELFNVYAFLSCWFVLLLPLGSSSVVIEETFRFFL